MPCSVIKGIVFVESRMNTKTNQKIKYFLYARKSSESEDRQVASIESQIKELTKIAKRENLRIAEILQESQSAKGPGRPVFNSMIARISKGEAAGVICWKLDRLARNPIDGGNIAWMIQKGVISHIQTYEKSYYPSDNVLMMSVEFGMANQFIRDLSVNTKRGLISKAEKGWFPGVAPLGYKNNRFKLKGEKDILPDEERFPLVRKAWDMFLTGNYSVASVGEYADKELGLVSNRMSKCIVKSKFYELFTNPFYYGWFKYGGVLYKGNHKPMITEEEFNRAQVILGNRNKAHAPHKFAFTGMIRCGECGSAITAEEKIKRQKNGNVHFYTFYHCTKRKRSDCSQKYLRKEEMEAQIMDILERIEIPPEFSQWAIAQLKKEANKEVGSRKSILTAQRKNYDDCLNKLDRLLEMRMNEEITPEEFAEKKTGLNREKSRLLALVNESDSNADDWLEKAEKLFDFAASARQKFINGSLDDKKEILAALGSNLTLKDQILSISIQKPLVLVEKAAKEITTIYKAFEPLKISQFEANFDKVFAKNPLLGERGDSNPQPSHPQCETLTS